LRNSLDDTVSHFNFRLNLSLSLSPSQSSV